MPQSLNIPQYTAVNGDTMSTTIKIHEDTKSQLDQFREYKNESYDEVIRKVVYIAKKCKKEPRLSKEAIEQIEHARKRMAAGEYYTMEEVKKRLGL